MMARSTMGADAAMTVRQTSDCSFPDLSRCAQCLSGGFLASWYLSPVMSDTLAQRASASPAVTASSKVDAAATKGRELLDERLELLNPFSEGVDCCLLFSS